MAEKKKMSVMQLTILTAVNMLGSGIIMLPSKLAQVGTMSILSWLVTLTGAMCLAYCFARCGMFSKRTSSGMGGYAEYAYGKSGNFMANFTYAISLVIANVAIAVSAVGYGEVFLGLHFKPMEITLSVMVLIVITTLANFWGPRITGRIGSVTVWGVIVPVAVLSIIGWFWFNPHMYASSWNPHHMSVFSGISSSIPITLWAFLGLESASANSDAVENPTKNVPIAVLGGTIGAGVVYILSTNVMAGIVKNHALVTSNAPFGLTFSTMFNPTIGRIVMGLMVLACIGSLLGWQFTVAEVFRSSANEGYFPSIFKKLTKRDAPVAGMTVLMIVQLLLSLMTISPDLNNQFNTLVNLAVVTNLVPYVLSMGALKTIQMDAGLNSSSKGFRFANTIAVIAGIYSLYSMYASGSQAMVLGSLVAFAGWTVYGFISYKYDLTPSAK
jgi:putrescine:ornithine antiporter